MNDNNSKDSPQSQEILKQVIVNDTPPGDIFMLHAANNVLNMHKTGENEKIGSLKYYGVLVTTIISIIIAIFKYNQNDCTDYFINGTLLILLYSIGTIILRKLFAIRKNEITLSIELGSIYGFFKKRYPAINEYINASFKIYNKDTEIINRKGSDYFNFIMIFSINTAVLIGAFLFFTIGLELFLKARYQVDIPLKWLLLFVEPLLIFLNYRLFIWFESLTKE